MVTRENTFNCCLFVVSILQGSSLAGPPALSDYQLDEIIIENQEETPLNIDGTEWRNGDKTSHPYFLIGARLGEVSGGEVKTVFLSMELAGVYHPGLRRVQPWHDYCQWHKQMSYEKLRFVSGEREVGEVVPLFGIPYEISEATTQARNRGGKVRVVLKKDVQRKSKLMTDPFAHIIINKQEWRGEHTNKLHLKYDEEQQTYLVDIHYMQLSSLVEDGKVNHLQMDTQERIEAGKDIWTSDGVNPVPYRVVKIVPPVPEEGIPGWIGLRRRWPEIVPFGVE